MSDIAGGKAISAVHRGDVVEASYARAFAVRGSTGNPYLVTLALLPGSTSVAGSCTCKDGGSRCWHVRAARLIVAREVRERQKASEAEARALSEAGETIDVLSRAATTPAPQ